MTTLPPVKIPSGPGWIEIDAIYPNGMAIRRWRHGDILVLSNIAIMEMPDGNGTGPTWLVSVSFKGKRAKTKHIARVLQAFDLAGADEDNHHPGISRAFFLPCDPARRVGCECKVTERVVVDRDGYRWTTPVNEAEGCRGCEHAVIFGTACPIHAKEDQCSLT